MTSPSSSYTDSCAPSRVCIMAGSAVVATLVATVAAGAIVAMANPQSQASIALIHLAIEAARIAGIAACCIGIVVASIWIITQAVEAVQVMIPDPEPTPEKQLAPLVLKPKAKPTIEEMEDNIWPQIEGIFNGTETNTEGNPS